MLRAPVEVNKPSYRKKRDTGPELSRWLEWYKYVSGLGDLEMKLTLDRFNANCRIHFFILGGVFAVLAFSLSNQDREVLAIGVPLIQIVAYWHARTWREQVKDSSRWEAMGRQKLRKLEATSAFEQCIGTESAAIPIWNMPHLADLQISKRETVPSQRMLIRFITSLQIIHFALFFSPLAVSLSK